MSMIMLLNKIQTPEDLSQFSELPKERLDSLLQDMPEQILDIQAERRRTAEARAERIRAEEERDRAEEERDRVVKDLKAATEELQHLRILLQKHNIEV